MTLGSNEISDISFVGEAQGNGRTLSTLCRSLWLLVKSTRYSPKYSSLWKGFGKKTKEDTDTESFPEGNKLVNYFA